MVPRRSMKPWKIPLPSGSNPPVRSPSSFIPSRLVWIALGNIVFREGRAPQEKRVKGAIAGCVVTDYFTEVINAPSFGKTHGIVRVDDRLAKTTIDEPGKTARYSGRITFNPNDVGSR